MVRRKHCNAYFAVYSGIIISSETGWFKFEEINIYTQSNKKQLLAMKRIKTCREKSLKKSCAIEV